MNTSLEAYVRIRDEGLLAPQRMAVYELLYCRGTMTSGEVTMALRTDRQPHASYHRRLSELEGLGVVARGQERECKVTGYEAVTWYVTGRLPGEEPEPSPERMREQAGKLRERAAQGMARASELEAEAGRIELERAGRRTPEQSLLFG